MSVTIDDVRIALNNITSDELTDDTISQKIDTTTAILNSVIPAPVSAELLDIAIRDYAAYLSFVISNVYHEARFGPLTVKKRIDEILAALKEQANKAIKTASGGDVDIDGVTHAFKLETGYLFVDRDVEIPTRSVL